MQAASLLDQIKSWPLALLPHQLLSRIVRKATRWRARWFKNALIKAFIKMFNVDLTDAEAQSAEGYINFNHFFTRALQVNARPLAVTESNLVSPVDGCVSQLGTINANSLMQAKGQDYTLESLLGGDEMLAARFRNGNFATLYLSPRDYHRIHMPCAGQLRSTRYVPGRLFSVAPHTTRAIPGLFTRNERLICVFDTPCGPMALIMVGAIFVSCMETVWAGVVNPDMGMSSNETRFDNSGQTPVSLGRGAEMGRFNMGSTVILLFGERRIAWNRALQAGTPVRLGEDIGRPQPQMN